MNPTTGRRPAEPLSAILTEFCEDEHGAISVGEIVDRFGARAFGALLFIFSVPNVLPLPPGSSSILGLPLLLLAPQVAIGVRAPWLPRFIDDRKIKPSDLKRWLGRIIPRLRSVERLSRPRLLFLFGPIGDRVIGLICTLLACVLILPIPLGNLAPAICIGAFALALFQRDGVIALVGYLMASVSLGLLILSAGAVSLAITKMIGAFHG
jgi:hypothetical protein